MRPALVALIGIAALGGIATSIVAVHAHAVGRLSALQRQIAEAHGLPLGPDGRHWGEYTQHGAPMPDPDPRKQVDQMDARLRACWNATTSDELLRLRMDRAQRLELLHDHPLELAGIPRDDPGPRGGDLHHLVATVLRRELLRIPPGEALAWDSPLRQRPSWTSPAAVIADVRDWWTLPAALTAYAAWMARIADRIDASERPTRHELSNPPTGMRMFGHGVTPPTPGLAYGLDE